MNLEVNLDGRGCRRAHRHAVGAQLPGARRSRRHRGAAERRRTADRSERRNGRAPAVRVRDHARALLGRPRPVRHARRRHQRPVRGREPCAARSISGRRRSTSAAPTWAAPASCRCSPRSRCSGPILDGAARGGRVRHHVRDQGHDGQAAGGRESAVADHARHLPRDLPDDRRRTRAWCRASGRRRRGTARVPRARRPRALRAERCWRRASSPRSGAAGRQRRRRRNSPSASSAARSAQISPIRGTHPRRAHAPGDRP